MLLVAGSPVAPAGDARPPGRPAARRPTRRDLATYGRALQQRNGLLRAIREEHGRRATSCATGTRRSSTRAARSSAGRLAAARRLAEPLRGRPRRDRARRRPPGARPALRDERPASTRRDRPRRPGAGASPRPPRRRSGTARRSSGRTVTTSSSSSRAATSPAFASRGQQRTAILALKLAELDLLTDARRPAAAAPPRRRVLASSTRHGARTWCGGSPSCPRRSSRRRRSTTSTPRSARAPPPWAVEDGRWTAPRTRRPAGSAGDSMTSRRAADGADRRPAAGRGPRTGPRSRAPTGPGALDLDALVAERVPAATGSCRLVAIDADALLVEADPPIVAQELRLRSE